MMRRILSSHTLGMLLATLSWAAIAWVVYLFLKMLSDNGTGWIYLD
jgi:hypothetical protein